MYMYYFKKVMYNKSIATYRFSFDEKELFTSLLQVHKKVFTKQTATVSCTWAAERLYPGERGSEGHSTSSDGGNHLHLMFVISGVVYIFSY